MKKTIIIFLISLYIFIFLGFVFHTSAHPTIFHKYTFKNIITLTVFICGLIPYIFIINYLNCTSKVLFNKHRIIIYPYQKYLITGIILFFSILLPIECFLRYKYQHTSQDNYNYTIQNFHPFLQFQNTKDEVLHINSFGFRSDEIKKEKDNTTYRIFILGGSTVLNSNISYKNLFSKILQEKLQNSLPNKKIQVINAGVDGFTTEHSLIQYLFNIKDFNPDMVVMWHGINDWYYSCSPSHLSYGKFKTDYSNFYGAQAKMVFSYFQPKDFISMHFVTLDVITKVLKENLYSDLLNFLNNQMPKQSIYDTTSSKNTYDMHDIPSLETYKRNLQSLIDITKNDNVTFILGNQANLYNLKLDDKSKEKLYFPKLLCTNNGKYPSLSSVIQTLNQFNIATKQIAEENNIQFIDLESSLPKSLLYFVDDVHYTDKGNQVIADELFKNIISSLTINN